MVSVGASVCQLGANQSGSIGKACFARLDSYSRFDCDWHEHPDSSCVVAMVTPDRIDTEVAVNDCR